MYFKTLNQDYALIFTYKNPVGSIWYIVESLYEFLIQIKSVAHLFYPHVARQADTIPQKL